MFANRKCAASARVAVLLMAAFSGLIGGCSSSEAPEEVDPPVAPNPPVVPPPPPPLVNRSPSANAGADVTVNTGQTIALNASASADPDGDTLRFAWTIVAGPAGGATLTPADQATANFQATIAGTYLVQVSVQDPANASSTDSLTIEVGTPRSTTAITLEDLPAAVTEGSVTTVVVYLPAPAGPAGAQVTLQSSDAVVAEIPDSVEVVAGETVAAFNVDALTPGTFTVTATSPGVDPAGVTAIVQPWVLSAALSTGDHGVMVGETSTVTATLRDPAPAGGARVTFSVAEVARASLSQAQVDIGPGATQGSVTLNAVAPGVLTITAAVTGNPTSVRQRVMIIPPVASSTSSSASLIETARAAGTITEEQSIAYGVYAAYGAAELPAQYRGNDAGVMDSGAALRLAASRFASLSPQTQETLGKFMFPPIYSGSWGERVTPAAMLKSRRAVRAQAARASPCEGNLRGMPTTDELPHWAHLRTRNFKIWYPTVLGNDVAQYHWYTAEEARAAALRVAGTIQRDFGRLSTVLGETLSDEALLCNGGDGAIDVFVTRISDNLGTKAEVLPYLPGNCARPGWMWVAPDALADPMVARNLIAHELVHLFQLRYARPDCNDWRYGILDEATASWAWDHLYPRDPYEHRFLTGDGAYFAPLFGEWRASPLETAAGAAAGRNCNGYCDYPFFEWLDRKYGAQAIRGVLDATASVNAQRAFEVGLGGIGGGLEQLWPRWALAQWNDWQEHVQDEFNTWERVLAASIKHGFVRPQSHFIPATLDGASRRELGEAVFDRLRSMRDGELPAMTTNYLNIRFSDPAVSVIRFEHNSAQLRARWPRLKVQALQKIDGAWHAAEDWSGENRVTFCRDRRAERIEELVLVFSNSDAGNEPFLHEGPTVVQLYTQDEVMPTLTISNAPCGPWRGTASVTQTNAFGGRNEYTGNVIYRRFLDPEADPDDYSEDDPMQVFVPESGQATLRIDWIDAASCRQTAQLSSGSIGELDGILSFNYLSGVASGHGLSVIPNVTLRLQCPDADPIDATGPVPSQWLKLPITGAQIAADGRTLQGTTTETDAMTGVTTTSVWNLSAQPEN
jgi:hypothetical protein